MEHSEFYALLEFSQDLLLSRPSMFTSYSLEYALWLIFRGGQFAWDVNIRRLPKYLRIDQCKIGGLSNLVGCECARFQSKAPNTHKWFYRTRNGNWLLICPKTPYKNI